MKTLFAILIIGGFTVSTIWLPVRIDPQLMPPKFSSEEWSYPWYMQKVDTGFINLVDTVVTEADTMHIPHNAICGISWNSDSVITDTSGVDSITSTVTDRAYLPFARARSCEDSLSIVVYGKGNSYLEEVEITVIGRLYSVQYNTYEYNAEGRHKKLSEHIFKKLSLTLNKRNPTPGDLLIGTFEFSETPKENSRAYLNIAGEFAVFVEK